MDDHRISNRYLNLTSGRSRKFCQCFNFDKRTALRLPTEKKALRNRQQPWYWKPQIHTVWKNRRSQPIYSDLSNRRKPRYLYTAIRRSSEKPNKPADSRGAFEPRLDAVSKNWINGLTTPVIINFRKPQLPKDAVSNTNADPLILQILENPRFGL